MLISNQKITQIAFSPAGGSGLSLPQVRIDKRFIKESAVINCGVRIRRRPKTINSILIVEDDRKFLEELVASLESHFSKLKITNIQTIENLGKLDRKTTGKFTIAVAHRPEDYKKVVVSATSYKFALVMMDFGLGRKVKSGGQLTNELRKSGYKGWIMSISGHKHLAERIMGRGGDFSVLKIHLSDDLISKIFV